MLCGSHRLPHQHECKYDIKKLHTANLTKANPEIVREKMEVSTTHMCAAWTCNTAAVMPQHLQQHLMGFCTVLYCVSVLCVCRKFERSVSFISLSPRIPLTLAHIESVCSYVTLLLTSTHLHASIFRTVSLFFPSVDSVVIHTVASTSHMPLSLSSACSSLLAHYLFTITRSSRPSCFGSVCVYKCKCGVNRVVAFIQIRVTRNACTCSQARQPGFVSLTGAGASQQTQKHTAPRMPSSSCNHTMADYKLKAGARGSAQLFIAAASNKVTMQRSLCALCTAAIADACQLLHDTLCNYTSIVALLLHVLSCPSLFLSQSQLPMLMIHLERGLAMERCRRTITRCGLCPYAVSIVVGVGCGCTIRTLTCRVIVGGEGHLQERETCDMCATDEHSAYAMTHKLIHECPQQHVHVFSPVSAPPTDSDSSLASLHSAPHPLVCSHT